MHDWTALGVRCPRCLDQLASHDSELHCARCGSRYPVHFGIPDLRTGEDPYLSKAEDLAAAATLASRADRLDFPALLASYYESNPRVSPAQATLFTRGTLAAGSRAEATLAAWEQHDIRAGARRRIGETMLDVGCGTAPLAIAAAKRGWRAVGIDVGMRWLVLAQQRARESGVELPLVCANAEVLPFENASVVRAGGESVLENTSGPEQVLRELARVLGRRCRLWLSTPNKRSLGPDPHLGVLAGGWWPELLLRRHAERSGKVYPKRHLFTRSELRCALEAADFEQIRIELPDIAPGQREAQPLGLRAGIAAYQVSKKIPVVGALLRAVAPVYLVSATRA